MTEGRAGEGTKRELITAWLRRVVDVRTEEVRATALACLCFFLILCSWFVLRPVRDEAGVAGGVQNLAWLFAGTLLATLAANPIFSALVARLPVRKFVPATYRFFLVNLLVFSLLLTLAPEQQNVFVGRVFFVWTSVFNLFVVSVFWALMADVYSSEQGKRLFAFIGAGGTLGGVVGSAVTASLVTSVGAPGLLLISATLLEGAAQCARRFPSPRVAGGSDQSPEFRAATRARAELDRPVGGGALTGVMHAVRSPYLLGVVAYTLLFTVGSTFLYFQQAQIVATFVSDRAARTALFARTDLAVNVLSALVQLFVTGRLLRWLGVTLTLALLPTLSVIGFLGLSVAPTLAAVVAFQVLRRAGNFAVAGPTREILFTVLAREDKYKAKNFIDTFVYRAGDQLGAWATAALGWVGLGVAGTSLVAAPLAALWFVVSVWLGRKQGALARAQIDDKNGG